MEDTLTVVLYFLFALGLPAVWLGVYALSVAEADARKRQRPIAWYYERSEN